MNARSLLLLAALAGFGASASPGGDPIKILFVGNSCTFGRVDPVLSYNAANVQPGEQLNVAAVPEPGTWALLAGGLVLVAHRRKATRLRR